MLIVPVLVALATLFEQGNSGAAKPPELLNQAEVFNEDSYPFWAQQLEHDGKVEIRVEVDAEGKVQSCSIVETSRSPVLDDATCDLIRKSGRFAPATDKHGHAIGGTISRTVNWVLESQSAPVDFADGFDRVTYSVDAARKPTNCRHIAGPAGRPIDERACGEYLMLAEQVISEGPDDFDWSLSDIVLETAEVTGPIERSAKIGEGDDQVLVDRGRVRLNIDASGRVTECQIIEIGDRTDQQMHDWCERVRKNLFNSVAERVRYITMVAATYLKKRRS